MLATGRLARSSIQSLRARPRSCRLPNGRWLGGKPAGQSRLITSDGVLSAIRERRADVFKSLTIGNATLFPNLDSNVLHRFDPFAEPYLGLPKNYIRRVDAFEKAKSELVSASKDETGNLTVALKGPGGFGKTTLATDLIRDPEIRQLFPGIAWLNVGETPRSVELLRNLIFQCRGTEAKTGYIDEVKLELVQIFNEFDGKILVVLDDVWTEHDAYTLRRVHPNVCYLITSRIEASLLNTTESKILIDESDKATCQDIFCSTLPDQVIIPEDVLEQIRHLVVTRLGCWPLLINLVASDLAGQLNKKKPLKAALRDINDRLTEEGLEDFDENLTNEAKAEHRRKSVRLTITSSLRKLGAEDASRYESLGIFPGDVSIPITTLASLWNLVPRKADRLARSFDDQSLLRYEPPVETEEVSQPAAIRLHDVFRNYLEEKLSQKPYEVDRLHTSLLISWGNLYELPDAYAWRFLSLHLDRGHQLHRLSDLLISYKWLKAKFLATDAIALRSDTECFPHRRDLMLIGRALTQSLQILAQDKTQLKPQLYGRLFSLDDGALPSLCKEIRHSSDGAWLRPIAPCLTPANSKLLLAFVTQSGSRLVAAAISASGARALHATDDGEIWILELMTNSDSLVGTHNVDFARFAASGDLRWAISADDNGELLFWDLSYGTSVSLERRKLKRNPARSFIKARRAGSSYTFVGMSPNGRFAFCNSSAYDGIELWDTSKGVPPEMHSIEIVADHAAVSDEGLLLVGQDYRPPTQNRCRVIALDPSTGKKRQFSNGSSAIAGLALSANGCLAAAAFQGGAIYIWDLTTGNTLRINSRMCQRTCKSGAIIGISQNSQWLIGASRCSSRVFLIDLSTGRECEFGEDGDHQNTVTSVSITSDGTVGVTGHIDGTMRVWDMKSIREEVSDEHSGQATKQLTLETSLVMLEASQVPNSRAAVLSRALSIKTNNNGVRALFKKHVRQGYSEIAFSEDNCSCIAVTDNGLVHCDVEEQRTRTMKDPDGIAINTNTVTAANVSADGRAAVFRTKSGSVFAWDVMTEECILVGQHRDISVLHPQIGGVSIDISGNGGCVISGYGNEVGIWNLKSNGEGNIFLCEENHGVAISDDGKVAVSVSTFCNGTRLWNVESGKGFNLGQIGKLSDRFELSVVAIDRRGLWAASACGNLLGLWDLQRLTLVTTYRSDVTISECRLLAESGSLMVYVRDSASRTHLLFLEDNRD